MRIVQND